MIENINIRTGFGHFAAEPSIIFECRSPIIPTLKL